VRIHVCQQHKPNMSQARSTWQHVCVCVQVDKVLEQLREDPRVSATGAKYEPSTIHVATCLCMCTGGEGAGAAA